MRPIERRNIENFIRNYVMALDNVNFDALCGHVGPSARFDAYSAISGRYHAAFSSEMIHMHMSRNIPSLPSV